MTALNIVKKGKLIWTYSAGRKKSEFLHLGTVANCASELQLYVEDNSGKYDIFQKDNSDQSLRASCVCAYDTYCAVPAIQQNSITTVYEDLETTWHLAEGTGTLVIDTTSYCRWLFVQ